MFHLQGLDGVLLNIPLEDLVVENKINRLRKGHKARRLLDEDESPGKREINGTVSQAVKAYSEAIKFRNEREPLLHAYQIMKSPVYTLKPDMSLAEAWNSLKEQGVSRMPVLSEDGRIIGILSERDLMRQLCVAECGSREAPERKVIDVMIRRVITAGRVTDIRRIAKAMFENRISSMPIVDEAGGLTGIITSSDILYALINYPPLSIFA
jgi:acetoin utilization protein AcuB